MASVPVTRTAATSEGEEADEKSERRECRMERAARTLASPDAFRSTAIRVVFLEEETKEFMRDSSSGAVPYLLGFHTIPPARRWRDFMLGFLPRERVELTNRWERPE